jgi:hypothetical protein
MSGTVRTVIAARRVGSHSDLNATRSSFEQLSAGGHTPEIVDAELTGATG